MIRTMANGIKRVAAGLLSVLMILSQLVAPMPALAQDVSALPTLNLYYTIGEQEQSASAYASLYGEQPVYWVMLPQEVFDHAATVTLDIISMNPDHETFNSTSGMSFVPGNATEVDGSIATNIEMFFDGNFVGTYPVYFSSMPMPEPEEPDPIPVEIRVYHRDSQSGQDFDSYSQMLTDESFVFYPNSSVLPENYVLDSESGVEVTAFPDGTASQYEVVFTATYREPDPIPVDIVVIHRDSQSGQEFNRYSQTLTKETVTFYPDSSVLPENYVLDSDSGVEVTAHADGTASQYEVVFTATYKEPEPLSVDVWVYYRDSQTGENLYSYPQTLKNETFTFTPDASVLPENYVLDSEASVDVTANADGTASQHEVVFTATYISPEPDTPVQPEAIPVTVKVIYCDSQSGTELNSYTKTLTNEPFTFYPDAQLLPENYVLDSEEGVEVIAYADGTATQTEVVFTATYVQPEPDPEPETPPEVEIKNADVVVQYVDGSGSTICTETYTLNPDVHSIAPNAALVQSYGYALESTEAVTVEVYSNGTASVNPVIFSVKPVQTEPEPDPEPENKPAAITVNYLLDGSMHMQETLTLYAGEHTISPNEHAVQTAGFALAEGTQSVGIIVYADGTATQYEVNFTIVKPSAPEEPTQPEAGGNVPEGSTLIAEINREGVTNTGGLNLRQGPSTDYKKAASGVSSGKTVYVHSLLRNAAGEEWYSITYNDTPCYVMAKFVTLAEEKVVEADVSFRYVDETGADLMEGRTETLQKNTYAAADFAYPAPEGYTYQGVNAESIIVDENGANPSQVIFTYTKKAPAQADVTFRYVDETGALLTADRTETLQAGDYSTSAFAPAAPEGYTYMGASAESIRVDENGANPNEVVFTYTKIVPVEAEITFRYVDETGAELLPSQKVKLGKGTHDTSVYRYEAPESYTFTSVSSQTVTVDENGASPAEVVFTYTKNAPIEADVVFYYRNERNENLLEPVIRTLGAGEHAADAYYQDISGHSYVGVSAQQIIVDENGANPAEIVFSYERIPATASVTFAYVDQTGAAVPGLNSQTVTLSEGTYDTTEYAYAAPSGYVYSQPTAAQVTVDANGVASPAQVLFIYNRLPETAQLTVRYLDAERNALLPDQVITFQNSDFGKTFSSESYRPAEDPAGYVYAGVNGQLTMDITIDQYGVISPQTVEFTYSVRPAAEASVTFEYIANGRAIASPRTELLSEGENDVMEYAAVVDGYNLVSVNPETVTVSADGQASASVVTFTYEEVSHTALIKVHYRTSIGDELPGSPEIRELEVGTHTITPNAQYAPQGYNLSGNTQSYQVTVGEDLVAYPNSVTFTYYDASVKGKVTVNYYNTENNSLITSEALELSPGSYDLSPNQALVDAKGKFEVSDVLTNTKVEVKETGEAVPTVVNFYYKPANIEVYQGYLLVTTATALRSSPSETASSAMVLEKDTVLWTAGQYQSGAINWNSSQTVVGAAGSGWVNDAHVRRISKEEAEARIEEYEANNQPEAEQNPGYYITIMDSVPLRRYMDASSQAKYLKVNTVVYVSSQEYGADGHLWHETTYDSVTGYVRDGQLRKLTPDEVREYLESGNPIDPGQGGEQYDPNGASSYGYITKDSVNFRATPGGKRLKMLNRYGMALILGTEDVDGVTWYNVNYSGQIGWVHGDFFHQMSLTEFSSFMGSDEYYAGIKNNTATPTGSPSTGGTYQPSGSTGSATQGSNISSVEDWNVGIWQNTGVTPQTTYQPFNPYATPVATMNPKGDYTTGTANVKLYESASTTAAAVTVPQNTAITITGTVVMNGKTWHTVTYNGQTRYMEAGTALKQAEATSTPAPTSTFVIGTMIPISYEDESKETQTGRVPWGLIGGAIALVGGAGGVYAYAINQSKRRKAAAARAAASRRAQANANKAAGNAAAAAGTTSPYARRAVAAAPVAGTQQRSEQNKPQQMPEYRNYGAANPSPYSRPANAQTPYSSYEDQPYSPPAQNSSLYSEPADMSSPYSRPQQQRMNPYAAPVKLDTEEKANPYAAPAPAPAQPKPQASSNPYARPIGNLPPRDNAPAAEPSADPRRRTRMQRYHDAESGENNE